ncbi:MAG: DUF1788 domain-containing protein [Anaerolinea sp.]|nr:DUF1788 domain-containing protein [Anaerolinea sp.]
MQQRYQHLLTVISSQRFLQMQGLGNEVPFFICPYSPKDALEMAQMVGQLARKLEQQSIHVLKIDLYDLAVEILHARDIWERVLAVEQTTSKAELLELLQNVLDPERHLVPAIVRQMRQHSFDVMFISGVGEVFPYIRSHTLLNNLQSAAQNHSTVLFFPGAYTQSLETGASLDLFERLHDDKYYRAFNIYDFHV